MFETVSNPTSPQLTSLLFGFFSAQVTATIARLGVPDLLAEGPRSLAELAQATGADERSLQRLLRGAVGFGLLDLTVTGDFAITASAELLRSDVPGSLRATAVMFSSDEYWRSWGGLETAVRSGNVAFNSIFGVSYFAHLEQHPEQRATLLESLTDANRRAAAAIAERCDLSTARALLDVGGGDGEVLKALLKRNPQLSGTLFDLPESTGFARQKLSEAGLEERSEVIGGDFFNEVPTGYDAYLLKNVLHNWDDRQSSAILANIRTAIPEHSRLFVVENVIPEDSEGLRADLGAVMFDHVMMVVLGGMERTASEYRTLLEGTGFAMESISKAPGAGDGVPSPSVLTARPV